MSTVIKYLTIDSKKRIRGNSCDFEIPVSPALGGINKISLLSCSIPLTHYNINSSNNVLVFSDGVLMFNVVLPIGSYTRFNIEQLLEDALNLSGSGIVFTVEFSDFLYKLTISGDAPFSLLFASNTLNSIAYVLGFDPVDTALAVSHMGNNSMNLSVPPLLGMQILEFPSMSRDTDSLNWFTFPINTLGDSSDISLHFAHTQYYLDCKNYINNANNLHIRIINLRDNLIFNNNNADINIVLELC